MPVPRVSATRNVSYFVLAASFLTTGSGCLLPTPIAVFPGPEVGSGMGVAFCDGFGEPIREDGLLIVHREYKVPVGWKELDLGVSNKVIEIINGKATIPHQWNAASLWLMPNPFSLYLIPMPYVLPGDNLEIIPLIAGYNYHGAALEERVFGKYGESFPSEIHHSRFRDGRVCLSSSARQPDRGIMYLESYTLPYLHRPGELRGRDDGPDLCLSDEDYVKVTTFIKAELERLRATQSQESQPTALPQ